MNIKKVLIIAEAGVNHNGDLKVAKQLIDVASDAGVDLVKFQTFKAETIVSPKAQKALYQKVNIGDDDNSQFNMLKKLELSHEDHMELNSYCESKGVKFFSTAFDTEGLDYLNKLGFDQFKIPSGEITNYPYLVKIASFKKPVILSTGMASFSEVSDALELLIENGLKRDQITILHCNTEYPTPMKDVNLLAMHHISRELGVSYGYSDHTLGIEVPVAAVALGASVIEKHFTLSRNLPGPDHKASLEPTELKQMVNSIRNIEMAISGTGFKETSESEMKNREIARKSIHYKRDIPSGHIITEEDLIPLRPGNGVSPMQWKNIIGKKTSKNVKAYEMLSFNDIETV